MVFFLLFVVVVVFVVVVFVVVFVVIVVFVDVVFCVAVGINGKDKEPIFYEEELNLGCP